MGCSHGPCMAIDEQSLLQLRITVRRLLGAHLPGRVGRIEFEPELLEERRPGPPSAPPLRTFRCAGVAATDHQGMVGSARFSVRVVLHGTDVLESTVDSLGS